MNSLLCIPCLHKIVIKLQKAISVTGRLRNEVVTRNIMLVLSQGDMIMKRSSLIRIQRRLLSLFLKYQTNVAQVAHGWGYSEQTSNLVESRKKTSRLVVNKTSLYLLEYTEAKLENVNSQKAYRHRTAPVHFLRAPLRKSIRASLRGSIGCLAVIFCFCFCDTQTLYDYTNVENTFESSHKNATRPSTQIRSRTAHS